MSRQDVEPLGYADVQALRREGAITEALMVQGQHALVERERIRKLVLRHADLVARLAQRPISLREPTLWHGNVPSADGNSELHAAYTAIVTEAERRESRAAA